jgi:site-specific DNA-methyltransferase (adenine-specific)
MLAMQQNSLNLVNNSCVEKFGEIMNQRNKMDGLELLSIIPNQVIKCTFFDPQYRGVLDKLNYGNEGKSKEKRRCEMQQMSEEMIVNFIELISEKLLPSGHLFLWIDKFHLCEGTSHWFKNTQLSIVDMITWEKPRIGMGYRTRRKSEYMLILQKKPTKVKGIWTIHNIPDVWQEAVDTKMHPHTKPLALQQKLIEATSNNGDIILDPAMGSGSVLQACVNVGRNFIGADING